MTALWLLVTISAIHPALVRAQAPSDTASYNAVSVPSPFSLPPPRLGGYIQLRQVYAEHAGINTFLNRARLSADGVLPQRFGWRALLEMQASAGRNAPATVSLREATVKWSPAPFALTAGEFKTPFTREYLIPVPQLELADLAIAVDSLAPKYDVGVMAEATSLMGTIQLGLFNGEGANAIANRDSVTLWVARVTGRPIPQLALGLSGTNEGPDSLRWGADGSVSWLGATLRSEYLTRHRRGRDRAHDDFGWYAFESVRVLGPVQLLGRQEDFQRPRFGPARRVRGAAYGINYDIAPGKVRLLVEFTRRNTGRRQTRSDSFLAQIQGQL